MFVMVESGTLRLHERGRKKERVYGSPLPFRIEAARARVGIKCHPLFLFIFFFFSSFFTSTGFDQNGLYRACGRVCVLALMTNKSLRNDKRLHDDGRLHNDKSCQLPLPYAISFPARLGCFYSGEDSYDDSEYSLLPSVARRMPSRVRKNTGLINPASMTPLLPLLAPAKKDTRLINPASMALLLLAQRQEVGQRQEVARRQGVGQRQEVGLRQEVGQRQEVAQRQELLAATSIRNPFSSNARVWPPWP